MLHTNTNSEKRHTAHGIYTDIVAHVNNHMYPKMGSFDALTPIEWQTIAHTPFTERIYTNNKLLVKIAYRNTVPGLIARTREDIKKESYGHTDVSRPFVAFTYRHDGMEKSFWFYEHNILPLIALDDVALSVSVAQKYAADAFIGDMASARTFLPEMHNAHMQTLKHIVICDTAFDMSFLRAYANSAEIHLHMVLPEYGCFGHVCPDSYEHNRLVFHPDRNSYIECIDGELVLTKLFVLPTPMLRYKSGIRGAYVAHTCNCNATETIKLYV